MVASSRGSVPINPDRVRRLMDYGLTEYQARVYLTLLELGTATASRVPALSRVPRTRIYATVQQLHAKGLVHILPERPLRYRAVPFGAYLRVLAEEHRNRARDIEASLDVLAKDFPVASKGAAEAHGRFEALYGRRNVRDRIAEMYADAERKIIAIGSTHSPGRILRAFAPELADRRRVGVQIELAFYLTPENADHVRALSRYGDIRTVDFFLPVCRHGVDDEEFLMNHPIPDDESSSRGEDIAIWTDDPAIAGAMTQMAEILWKMGTPLDRDRPQKDGPRARLTPSEGS